MANNQKGLDRAKNEGEPLFISQARANACSCLEELEQMFGDADTKDKIDIRGFDTSINDYVLIDVKDIEDENLNTGNFSISNIERNHLEVERQECKENGLMPPNRRFAFRLAKNGKRTCNFIYVDCFDVFEHGNMRQFGDKYWLVSESSLRRCKTARVI